MARCVFAIAVSLALCLGCGSAALATPGNDATIVAAPFELAPSQSDGAIARCPPGQRAVGGGLDTQGSPWVIDPNDKGDSHLEVSGPRDETGTTAGTDTGDVPRSWYGAIRNGTGETRTFKVFAICSQSSDATIQATAVDVPPRDTPGNTSGVAAGPATCPV